MNKISNIFRVIVPLFFGMVMYTLIILITGLRERSGFSLSGFLWFAIMTSIFWEGSRFISKRIDSKFSSKTSLPKKLVWQLIALILFGVITFNVSYLIIRLHEIYIQGNTGNGFAVIQFVSISAIGAFLVLAIGGLQMGVFYFLQWQKSQVETERLQKEQTVALFQNLRNQISPHFLFNNLNTLNSLIHESPEVASKFLSLFAEVYRYSLQQRDEEVVTLESELDMLESYLYLLKKRFENAFTVEIEVGTTSKRRYIPPMSLQLLVENALKHNIAEPTQPLIINIKEQGNALLIVNNLQLRKEKKPSTQIGLSNLTERYRLLGQPLPEIEKTAEYFRVTLPLLTIGEYEVVHH
jgi:histidine kinase